MPLLSWPRYMTCLTQKVETFSGLLIYSQPSMQPSRLWPSPPYSFTPELPQLLAWRLTHLMWLLGCPGAIPRWHLETINFFLSETGQGTEIIQHFWPWTPRNVFSSQVFLQGRRFHIYTDHKPLTFAFASSSDRWTPRQQRHLAVISEYTTDVRHVEGRNNAVADALSRVEICENPVCMAATPQDLNHCSMAQAQQVDAGVQAYNLTAITQLALADLPIPGANTSLLCDISTGVAWPVVPLSWRRVVFDAIHGLAHPGIKTTRKMVAARFVWHGMNKQVGIWAKSCIPCQKAKVQRHVTASLEHGQLPDRCFQMLTSWNHYPFHRVTPISSRSLIATHDGQKPYRWLMPQRPHVPVSSFLIT